MANRGKPGPLSEIFTRNFLLLATINLTMFFGFQMTNVGLPVYVAQLGAGAHVVGLVGTVMTITAVIVRIFAGPLLDRFGRKGALVGGSVIMVASIASYAVFPFVGIILGVRLLQGVGWGLGSTASSTIAADIIPKRRFAEGMGYFAMTNSISSALAPAVSIALVQGPGAEYMILVAAGCTALALLLSVFQRNSSAETSRGTQTQEVPRSSGADALPDKASGKAHAESAHPGAQGEAALPALTDVEAPAPAQGNRAVGGRVGAAQGTTSGSQPPAPPHAAAPPSGLAAVFERRALLPGLLMLLVNIGFGCITSFIALHGQEQGIAQVSVYFVVYAIVTLASRPLIGQLIDRYGFRMPSILACLGTACTLVLIGLSRDVFMIAAAGALAGLGVGTAMSVYQAMAVAAVEPWRRGVATSTYFVAFDIGIAIGSLVGGVIASLFGYAAMYIIIALSPLVAGLLSAALIKR